MDLGGLRTPLLRIVFLLTASGIAIALTNPSPGVANSDACSPSNWPHEERYAPTTMTKSYTTNYGLCNELPPASTIHMEGRLRRLAGSKPAGENESAGSIDCPGDSGCTLSLTIPHPNPETAAGYGFSGTWTASDGRGGSWSSTSSAKSVGPVTSNTRGIAVWTDAGTIWIWDTEMIQQVIDDAGVIYAGVCGTQPPAECLQDP